MKINKILTIICLMLYPLVVISFTNKEKVETNFILAENQLNQLSSNYELSNSTIETNNTLALDNLNTINIKKNGQILNLNLEDYIIGVVAGEMPASFNMEALKAQAVAARSYALYKKGQNRGSYDLVATTSDQVYITENEMRKKWGKDYDYYYNRVKSAVNETSGEVMTHNNNIIESFYFAISNGYTQDVKAAFNQSFDYLKTVESEYETESISGFKTTKTYTKEEVIKKLGLSCSLLTLDNVVYNDGNYVESITLCNKTFTGMKARNLLNLRSPAFVMKVQDKVYIEVYGYGHGVGMSQYGAQGYANNGYLYKDILNHYYSDIEIKTIKNV